MKKVRQLLRSLSEAPLQAYLDNRVQLFDIIEMILSETGPAEIYISTFSTSEEFLRRSAYPGYHVGGLESIP